MQTFRECGCISSIFTYFTCDEFEIRIDRCNSKIGRSFNTRPSVIVLIQGLLSNAQAAFFASYLSNEKRQGWLGSWGLIFALNIKNCHPNIRVCASFKQFHSALVVSEVHGQSDMVSDYISNKPVQLPPSKYFFHCLSVWSNVRP